MADKRNGGSANAPWEDGGGGSWPGGQGGRPGRVVVGGPGPDELVGGRGDDILRGDTEDHLIDGRGGVDTARVVGTNAADALAVGRNIAVDDPGLYVFGDGLYGGERVQLLNVERLEIFGRGGDDRLVVSDLVYGTDVIFGRFVGGSVTVRGVDLVTFYGGRGDDTLDATAADGPVAAFGGVGDDALTGGAFADRLIGGPGEDVLQGSGAADRLQGGSGDDTFVYTEASDAPIVAGKAREWIGDFAPGEDVIDLSDIDAVPGGNDDAFRFVGNRSPDFQILQSGDLYYDPEDQALKGFVGNFIAYAPNFAVALPGLEALSEADLIL